MARTAVLGLPRMGPEPRAEARAGGVLGRAAPASAELREAARALRAAELGPRARRRDRRDPVRRLQPLRPRARRRLGGRRDPRAPGRPGREGLDAYFALRARHGRRAAARDDQVVRHELPLPRPRARPRAALPRAAGALARAARARRGARDRDPPGRARPGDLPAALEGPGAAARRARRALPAYAELLERARRRGRARGADRRALPRARPQRRRARRDPAAPGGRWPRAPGSRSASRPTSPGSRGRALERGPRRCPSAELHLDLVRAPGAARARPSPRSRGTPTRLSLGVLDGRNVWAADLDAALGTLDAAVAALGERPRDDRARRARCCTSPTRPRARPSIPDEVRGWLAFAAEKLAELGLLARARSRRPRSATRCSRTPAPRSPPARRASARTNDPAVRARVGRPHARPTTTRGRPPTPRRAAQRERLAAARAAHDDDRLVPADRRDPRRPARPARRRRSGPPSTERFLEARIAEVVGDPGGARPRRARARRARAQRHGRVLRRAAARVRLLRARLGAVLRQPLREAADPLRRRLAPGADDGATGGGTPSRSPSGR